MTEERRGLGGRLLFFFLSKFELPTQGGYVVEMVATYLGLGRNKVD